MDSSNYIKGTNHKREPINEVTGKRDVLFEFDMCPYYVSNPVYNSYFNFNNVQRLEDSNAGKVGRVGVWGFPPKSKKVLAPQIVVMNLNKYFKENDYDYDILNSKLFKSNLNLFIEYQEKMVKNKILKINKSAYDFTDEAYKFYLKYKKTITDFLTHEYKNKWWEESIDNYEFYFEEIMQNRWGDLKYDDNPFIEYPKRILKTLPMFLLFPPAIMLVMLSKFKLEASYMAFKQKNNLKFYYDYLNLKKLLNNHTKNITLTRPNSIPRVDYSVDEYLESSEELLSGLNKIKNGRYYYNDNYLRKSSQQLITIPASSNEFVVFSSQYKSTKAKHEMFYHRGFENSNVRHPNYNDTWYTTLLKIPTGFFEDSKNIDFRDSRHLFINEWYNNKIDKFFDEQLMGRTWGEPKNYMNIIDIKNLYANTGEDRDEEGGGHTDTHGLIYSNMKYYRKNQDDSWNVYIVKPQPVRNHENEDWNYGGQSKYSNVINPWVYNKISGKFVMFYERHWVKHKTPEPRDDTLMYVIEFDRKIEKIHMVSELGIIETYNDTETSIKEGYSKFTPHFDYLNNYFSPISSIGKVEKIIEEYLDIIEDKPLNFYQNRGTGILTNYISWKTTTPAINYPKSMIPIKY